MWNATYSIPDPNAHILPTIIFHFILKSSVVDIRCTCMILFLISHIYSAPCFHANRIDCITGQVYLIKVPPWLRDAITKLNTIRHEKCCRRELLLCKPDRSVSHLLLFHYTAYRGCNSGLLL